MHIASHKRRAGLPPPAVGTGGGGGGWYFGKLPPKRQSVHVGLWIVAEVVQINSNEKYPACSALPVKVKAREIVSCHQSTENPFSPQLFYPLGKKKISLRGTA